MSVSTTKAQRGASEGDVWPPGAARWELSASGSSSRGVVRASPVLGYKEEAEEGGMAVRVRQSSALLIGMLWNAICSSGSCRSLCLT